MGFEKKRFDLDRRNDPFPQKSAMEVRKIVSIYLNPLGKQGWEVVAVGDNGNWVEAQRPKSRPKNELTWEYACFIDNNIFLSYSAGYSPSFPYESVHESWKNHLKASGWQKIDHGTWIDPYSNSIPCQTGKILYKRTNLWFGFDDGDIGYQLEAQWPDNRKFPQDKGHILEIFKQVLLAKWKLSENAGRDIGTYEAMKAWMTDFREKGYDLLRTEYSTWIVH